MESLDHNLRNVPSSRLVTTQLVISISMGVLAFLTFCILRCRFPNIFMARLNYLSNSDRKYLPPALDRHSLFGWLGVLYKITDDEVIQYAGLDAYVFLGFFKMSIKLLFTCWLCSTVVISPIRWWFTGDYDDDNGKKGSKTPQQPTDGFDYSKAYLWLYVIFTFVFTFVALHYLLEQASRVIKRRQQILGHQSSVTDRTISLSGVPPELRSERALKETIETLGIGQVENISICKEWKELDRLYKQRENALEKLERVWATYLGKENANFNVRPFAESSYSMYHDDATADPESNSAESALVEEVGDEEAAGDSGSISLENANYRKRPLVRTGSFGFIGPRVDAIDYYTQQLSAIDKEILTARRRHYPSTPTAFVTMDCVAAAQMFAQAVVDPRIGYLITDPAPAPRDIIWENLTLPRRERTTKQLTITAITGVLCVAFIVPVGYLATLLNMKSIRKFWPALGESLDNHPWAQDFVIDLLPVYLYTLLNFIIPYIYVWLSSKQGFVSHGEEEISVVSKNFFYVFVNMFLVFTMAGTASNYWGYLSDSKKIALQLAQSLRGLSSFYVDTILLQGLGLEPFKLLLPGQLVKFPVFRASCKTPRHYINLYKPPNFNFGLNLPMPMLTLIISLLYSVMSTKILSAGLTYFIVGYFVYKFQLIYSCTHIQHSTGQVMPIIFRRVIMGILLFQLTVAGSLALSNQWVLSLCITPLPFVTLAVWYYFEKNYQPLAYYIALRASSHEEEEECDDTPQQPQRRRHSLRKKSSTIDERREFNQTYEYPNLVQTLDGPWLAVEGNHILMATNDGVKRRAFPCEEY